GRLPVGLEVSFGRELDEEVEALAHAEPIMIPIGDRLALRVGGRIDRIDQVAPGKFEIVDYKTGGYFEDDWRGTFAGGTRLQHALYAVAAAELLEQKYGRASVTGGVYYFSSARGRQERVTIATPPAAALRAVLGTLREIIASGTFVHAAAESACKWCDFGNACGTDVFRRAGNKLGDKKLATYLRLTQHD
ncbi:MAG TPA: PD-(D/E)XK nuclease family protein, partial [Vicinamibacterales bacterium]